MEAITNLRFVVILSSLLFLTCGSEEAATPIMPPPAEMPSGETITEPEPAEEFLLGIERLEQDSFAEFSGQRIALVTHAAATDRHGTPVWQLLAETTAVELEFLYAPEHGLSASLHGELGDAEASEELVVKSLYGSSRAPDPAEIRDFDALIYDLVDVGARFYTYTTTLYLCIESCREAGIPLIVLDRPNPLGDAVAGALPEGLQNSFVGKLPIPVRYGLTAGELALWIAGELLPGAEVRVVSMTGYEPRLYLDEQVAANTDLPYEHSIRIQDEPSRNARRQRLPWNPPSPNLPRLEGAILYAGTGLFEPVKLSVGRGTERPFELVGAPWLDADGLADYWTANCPGAEFGVTEFTPRQPSDGRYDRQLCRGVAISITDRTLLDPLRLAVYGYDFLARHHEDRLALETRFLNRMVGDGSLSRLVRGEITPEEVLALWAAGVESFVEQTAPYRLY
ncbi:DUF1343 domain-containing protein [bacterium]|nr:DUF1343 domain-containing protein [bacterium]